MLAKTACGSCGVQRGSHSLLLLVETLENGVETYGVLVEYLTQRTEVPGITVFRHRAEALLELLRRGRVTPVTVRDVMEDWLLI